MTSKTKVKQIKDTVDEKTEFLGYISDLGNGIVLDDDLQVMLDENENPIEVNLMNTEQYNLLDTHGLSNIGNYPSKEQQVKQGELEFEDPLSGEIKRVNLRKPYVINETKQGLLIKSADKEQKITKEEFIDSAINSKPRTLRAPKFLVLDQKTPSNVAEAIIERAYEEIAMNNLDKQRADTLNIVTVPKEQWERMAIKGEVEKEIFGKYGYPSEKYDLSTQAKLLRDLKLGNITKQQFKQQFTLPNEMTLNHPFDKEYIKGQLIAKEVQVKDLEYEILTDPDPKIENDPDVIGIYNIDNHKLLIKKGNASIISHKQNNPPKTIDLTKQIGFKDPDVLNVILGFQPDFYSPQNPSSPKAMDHGVQKTQGLASTRIGIPNSNMPNPKPSEEMEKLVKNSPELQQWKQTNPKQFDEYMKALTQFEDSNTKVSPVQCVQGAVPIIRKASLDAWGTTPKQFRCKKPIVSERIDQVNSKMEEIKQRLIGQGKNASQLGDSDLRTLAIDELNNDPNFKSIVGCNTTEELQILLGIDTYNKHVDELIAKEIISKDPKLKEGKDKKLVDKLVKAKIKELEPKLQKQFTSKKSFILVPMRFPTERAMGDTIYCRSISNISPYSIKATERGESEIKELGKGIEELAFMEDLTPEQVTLLKKRSAIDVSFKRNTLRKKNVLLLRDSTKSDTTQTILNALDENESEQPQKVKYNKEHLKSKVKK